ncbi:MULTISPECIES: hypothetical protein [unclassified Gilliamella]|uniref:hypothetical protein n=1 Tax=unclassified Gilliamella TaxID=2685620 RepID=UPI00159EF0FF|nr:hypothetical protein [Gilliamella apicola]
MKPDELVRTKEVRTENILNEQQLIAEDKDDPNLDDKIRQAVIFIIKTAIIVSLAF